MHPLELGAAEADLYRGSVPEIDVFSQFFWLGSVDVQKAEAADFLTAAQHGRVCEISKFSDVGEDVYYSILCTGGTRQLLITFRAGATVCKPVFVSKAEPVEPVEVTEKISTLHYRDLEQRVRWRDILRRFFR